MLRKILTNHGIFLLIFVFAAFVRFFRISEMAPFDFDQEYASTFAYRVLHDNLLTQLIGQELSVQGLFIGPLYFWALVPFFALSGLHPIGGFVASALLGLAIITAYYFVGWIIFGKTAGIIAALVRSVLFTELTHDWSMVPSYGSELLVLITWFCFYKYWKGDMRFLPLLALSFGLYTSIHPILFPFYLVFVLIVLAKRSFPSLKTLVISLELFIIPILPLLLFEFFHNFLEVKRLISFFGGTSTSFDQEKFTSFIQFNISEISRIMSLDFIPQSLFILLLLVALLVLVIKKVGFWKERFHLFLFITYLVFLLYYSVFPGHVPEYYFLALSTLALLYMSALIGLIFKNHALRVIGLAILFNIAYAQGNLIIKHSNNPSLTTLSHKDTIVKAILSRQPEDQEFFVSYISLPGWNFGFAYLFKQYGHEPQTREVKQPIYTIVIPKELSPAAIDISSGNIGLILPD
ncbi:hypothetical protein HY405_02325 [Candidatus Microgenomates bacterium]|nr:hypothetical protein [Candidatus Microgenomates bacterium]